METTIFFVIIIIICTFVLSLLVPIKFSIKGKKEKVISYGLVCVIEQTTGPVWRIKEIFGDNKYNLSTNQLIHLQGFDPYKKLSRSVITCFQNVFVFSISDANTVYDEELGENLNILTVESWNICYPIIRELSLFSYSNKYLNVYDFRWL